MKTLICITTISLSVFIFGSSLARSQTQTGEGYTFVTTAGGGPQVCLGRWLPPRDVGLAGVCEGQMFALPQLAAISAKQSVDRLDQLLVSLASIDQKLAVNNEQISRLIQATVNTQTSIDRQVRQTSELLREAITKRFDALPKEILANDEFKKEIARLKEDILEEVEKHYSTRPTPPKK